MVPAGPETLPLGSSVVVCQESRGKNQVLSVALDIKSVENVSYEKKKTGAEILSKHGLLAH